MSTSKASDDTGSMTTGIAASVGRYRWMICALLFFCTTINYIDRNSLSVLKTTLQAQLHWTDVDYGWITTAFTCAYAMFPSLIGFFVDKFGVKKALAGALVLWSFAAASATSTASAGGARSCWLFWADLVSSSSVTPASCWSRLGMAA